MRCVAPDCTNTPKAKGYCVKHYAKIRRTGTLDRVVGTDKWRENLVRSHAHSRSEIRKLDSAIDTRKGQRGSLGSKIASTIKADAIKAGYVWELHPIEVYRLFVADCVYCGARSGWPEARNGIDRVDSTVGYISYNCVTACSMCNRAKGDKTVQQFMEWAKRLCTKNGWIK
jgi:hypothetical protein